MSTSFLHRTSVVARRPYDAPQAERRGVPRSICGPWAVYGPLVVQVVVTGRLAVPSHSVALVAYPERFRFTWVFPWVFTQQLS